MAVPTAPEATNVTLDLDSYRLPPTHYAPPLVPWEDFLAWVGEERRAEWVDGEIVEMSPANDEHQRLAGFLYVVLWLFTSKRGLGEVFQAPFLMHLPTRPSGREPDLLFVRREHADRVTRTYLNGPADLVVEIVSPDSGIRDRREKHAEYEAAGVPEYWLIDQPRQDARFYVLGEDGRYREAAVGDDGAYASAVLAGLRLPVAWLWRRPLPTIHEILAHLAI